MAIVTKLHYVLYPVTEFRLYETIDSGTIIQLLFMISTRGKATVDPCSKRIDCLGIDKSLQILSLKTACCHLTRPQKGAFVSFSTSIPQKSGYSKGARFGSPSHIKILYWSYHDASCGLPVLFVCHKERRHCHSLQHCCSSHVQLFAITNL